jgi:hypothetical protein
MFGIRTLVNQRDSYLVDKLSAVTRHMGHTGVFNVSQLVASSGVVVAYRGFPSKADAPRAFICKWDLLGIPTVTDLSTVGEQMGLKRVADPKLFVFDGDIYLTFNTGYVKAGHNAIYILRVTPDVGTPQLVVADFERQSVEKNWGFGATQSGSLAGIYELLPYKEVRLVQGALGSDDDLIFAVEAPRLVSSSLSRPLSLGTQPMVDGDRRVLISHEKILIGGRRMYFGRAVSIEGFGTDSVTIRASADRLIHNIGSALPRRRLLNKNLLSATYFSGIDSEGDDILLGYGINDAAFSIARIERKKLWP